MTRGEVWLAQVGRKARPVLVLTRPEVLDVRRLVTVAEITTSIRGIAAEVAIEPEHAGLDRDSVVNCDGIHTIEQTMLTSYVGTASDVVMARVCSAISYGLGC